MSNLRTIWHFKPQNTLHQRMINPTTANFFTILLQYNSKVRIVLQQYSKKKKIYFIHFFPRNFSLLYLIILVLFPLFPLFLLYFSIYSLLSSDPNTILLPTSTSHITMAHFFLVGYDQASFVVVFFFFLVWVTVWVSGGCGFWRGSLWWLLFSFFGCDRCLKGFQVVVGLWLKWVVGRGSAKLHTASLSSLIVDQRAGFGSVGWDRLMVGLKQWIC